MVRPQTRDLFQRNSITRVFSKTLAFTGQRMACSGGIFLPVSVLNPMSPRERENALRLCASGLLIVEVTSARDFFAAGGKSELPGVMPLEPWQYVARLPTERQVPGIQQKF